MVHFLRAGAVGLCLCVCAVLLAPAALAEPLEQGAPISLTAPSAILMEAETGAVIFEKNADDRRPAASVNKLMTLLIVLEKLDRGDFTLEDKITVSPAAAAQPGSQAFLDAHAVYSLKDLLKATIIASANDAAAALAEYTAGTEEAFAALMNEKAAALNLQNSRYVNCTGLPAEGQYTCARDVAVLSREVARHPAYFTFSSVWLDSLTHPSGRVTDLTNTNRLVRFYKDCDGMKTGSTNEAKYCLSATAQRNGMRLIAVVLGVPNSQTRFDEARAMLDYGFSAYSLTPVAQAGDWIGRQVKVNLGAKDQVDAALGQGLTLLLRSGMQSQLSFEAELTESVAAPVRAGDPLGNVWVLLAGKRIAQLPAVAAQDVRLPGMLEGVIRLWENWR